MNFDLKKLVRPNIEILKAYSSAKEEYTGDAKSYWMPMKIV